MFKIENDDIRWILPRFCIIVGIIFVCFLVISLGMKMFNKSLGLEGTEGSQELMETMDQDMSGNYYTPETRVSLPEIEALPEGPEASWEITPCSLWVSASSEPVADSLPEAPAVELKPLEALFLVRRWAREAGIPEEELETVYVFTNLDTIYVDLPAERDLEGLKLTIENRFICFTRLFPMVAGHLLSSYPEGIHLRGIEGVFRR